MKVGGTLLVHLLKLSQAIFDYTSNEADELSFDAGDIVYVLDWADPDWWRARCKGREGQVHTGILDSTSYWLIYS
jgi:hypothetical protein